MKFKRKCGNVMSKKGNDIDYLEKTEWVKKSNLLINQIGARSSLLAEKVFLYSLTVIEKRAPGAISDPVEVEYYKDLYHKTKNNFAEGLVSVIKSVDFRKAIRNKSGSYYTSIEKMMNTGQFRKNWDSLYRDKDIVSEIAIVTGTAYDKRRGMIFIKFNSDVEDILYDLKKDYTRIPADILYLSNSVYEMRIFQILRSKLTYMQAVDKKNRNRVREECVFQMTPAEFKFQIGVSGIDTQSLSHSKSKEALLYKNNYDLAESLLPLEAKGEARYCDLESRILSSVFKSINGFDNVSTDSKEDFYGKAALYGKKELYFYYKPIRKGKGGKVVSIEFTVGWIKGLVVYIGGQNERHEEKTDMLELVGKCLDAIPDKLPSKDYHAILAAANNDIGKIVKAVEVLKGKKDVGNVTAFLISAIKEGYEPGKVRHLQGEKKMPSNSFRNFQQRNYDYEEIEKQLLDNDNLHPIDDSEDIETMLEKIRNKKV